MQPGGSTRLGWDGGVTSITGCGLCPSQARGDTAMILLRCFTAHVILVFVEIWKRCCFRGLGSPTRASMLSFLSSERGAKVRDSRLKTQDTRHLGRQGDVETPSVRC